MIDRLKSHVGDGVDVLYLALTILYLTPIWLVQYFPTQDGPCHVYNALILKEYYNTEAYPLFQEYYDLNLEPLPNWFSHAVMALLMFAFDPIIAEKILVTGYVVLFLCSGRYLIMSVDPAKKWLAFALFPLVYNYLLQKGFYNFSYSVGFGLWAIGYWWKHRQAMNMRRAVVFNSIMVICYFSHMVSTVIALLSVAILWLVTIRPAHLRNHLKQIPLLLPACILPLWFVLSQGTDSPHHREWSSQQLFEYFTQLGVLVGIDRFQIIVGRLVALVFLVLLLWTVRKRIVWSQDRPRCQWDDRDGFLLIGITCIVLYVFLPEGVAGGLYLTHRLSLYPFLIILPWLALPERRGVKLSVAGVLAGIALINIMVLNDRYMKLDGDMQEFQSGLEEIAPGSRIMPLVFDRYGRCLRIRMFSHGIGYQCAYTGGIGWDNYEAATDYFATVFKPEWNAVRPKLLMIEEKPEEMDIARYVDVVDYVFTWALPPGSPVQSRIESHYELVSERGRGRLYRRR